MEQKPYVLTEFALARLLKEFAGRLGTDDGFSDILAQMHLQQSSIPWRWSEFMVNNCMQCRKDPNTCDVLNPKPENCRGKTTPRDVQVAGALSIETGHMKMCPALHLQEAP